MPFRKGFTLIELLIVIAVIAILAIVVILTLNPAVLLQESRDSNRISDMNTLTSALGLYTTDQSGATNFSMGSSSVVYVSIPDPAATTTAGSNCSSLGLLTLPAGYTYHCAGPNYYRNINGSGWIPVNFSNITAGTPMGNLPVDPTNQSSSRQYYTYTTNGIQYEITAAMESARYQLGGSNDEISGDGGPLATVYAKGSNMNLESLDYGDPTSVGYWPINEGTGSSSIDQSGNGNNLIWIGNQAGTSGYYSPGKNGTWSGIFDGSTDYITSSTSPFASRTYSAFSMGTWFETSVTSTQSIVDNWSTGGATVIISISQSGLNGELTLYLPSIGWQYNISSNVCNGSWQNVYITYNGSQLLLYLNGVQIFSHSLTGTVGNFAAPFVIRANKSGGGNTPTGFFQGLIQNVRFYSRALTAAQIAAIYNGGK